MEIKSGKVLVKSIPILILLTPENYKQINATLVDFGIQGIELTEAHTQPDENYYYYTPEINLLCYGLGNISDLKTEKLRKAVFNGLNKINDLKAKSIQIYFPNVSTAPDSVVKIQALIEIPYFVAYQFRKYITETEKPSKKKYLESVILLSDWPETEIENIIKVTSTVTQMTCWVRDLVNEPPNVLTPTELANRAKKAAAENNFDCEVFEQEKIKALKMGGLLAVNLGSQEPPTFSILTYKHPNPINSKPIVLVGKGITFDTGGLSLKPTPGSMDSMKSDMAGAAVVIGVIAGVAKNKLPLHIIGLIPSTDNRPGENAYTPNDVITMYSGKTVEVLNTDAEGRLILADALAFAKQYDPELVIDLATLTGAAVIAVGNNAIVAFSTAPNQLNQLKIAGEQVHERIVELPLWEEYGEQIKSDIADIKNVGGKYAGAITAAKFLEHFIAYPWIHLDIAGVSFLETADNYRCKNGTGIGVRLLYQFLANYKPTT